MIRKVEMTMCDGLFVYDWIVDVEHFFTIGRYSDEAKLDNVPLSLQGKVKKWFAWVVRRGGFRDWEDFKQKLFVRFAESIEDEPETRLFSIRQTGSVADYVSEFEELSAQVMGLADHHLERIFYNGLNPEMKEVIRMKDPQGLANFIAAVLKMESSVFCKVLSTAAQKETRYVSRTSYSAKNANTGSRLLSSDKNKMEFLKNKENVNPGQSEQRPRQKYSDAELDELRRNKLCFKCQHLG